MPRAVVINGSYRRGGVTDQLLAVIAGVLAEEGFEVATHVLADNDLRFCRNCRACTQEPGPARGACPVADDAAAILDDVDRSDLLVVGAPVNFFSVTAVTRVLLERLVCYAYWPWGQPGPRLRLPRPVRPALLVTSSAMPAPLGRWFTSGLKTLKILAKTLGARPVLCTHVGMVAQAERWVLPERTAARLRRRVRRVVASIP